MSNHLLLIGSGPGIGLAVASLFASKPSFSKITLISRNATRLSSDREFVIAAISGKKVEVLTHAVDISNTADYKKVLAKIADVDVVVFNAARVQPSPLLEFEEEELVKDFATTNIALYTTAQWAVPILSKKPASSKPTFLVTSSFLWKEPYPVFFSLSMTKASQRNLIQSLSATYENIHFALVNVGGVVSPDEKNLNPTSIATHFWDLYSQEKSEWKFDVDIYA